MIDRNIVRSRTPLAPVTEENAASAAEIAAKLDEIVGKSRRLPPWRRALRRAGGAVAHWLDQLVPPAPASGDTEPPPQIRFPFY